MVLTTKDYEMELKTNSIIRAIDGVQHAVNALDVDNVASPLELHSMDMLKILKKQLTVAQNNAQPYVILPTKDNYCFEDRWDPEQNSRDEREAESLGQVTQGKGQNSCPLQCLT